MNIVQSIKDHLSEDVLGKLSNELGLSADQTRHATDAVLPAALGGLGKIVSSTGGADKLANAMKGADLGSMGDIAAILTGGGGAKMLEVGMKLLKSLLGGGALPAILALLAKFTGIGGETLQKLLAYLLPMVLGSVAKGLPGGQVTPQGLTSFFDGQKDNIAAAMPAGLSLDSLPSLDDAKAAVGKAAGGLPGWLLPAAGIALLIGGIWALNQGETPAPAPPPPAGVGSPVAKTDPLQVVGVAPVLDAAGMGKDLSGLLATATKSLTGITDLASAEKAIPDLKELGIKLDLFKGGFDKLGEAGKKAVAEVAKSGLEKLKELITKVLGIPGVSEKLKPFLDAIVTKLTGLSA